MICALRSRSPELKQMNRALKSRTKPNESRYALWSPELNQMICALRSRSPELKQMIRALSSEAPNWTKWIALCAMKSRTEQNYSLSALWSPELNQMNRALCSEVPNWTKLFTSLCTLKSRTEQNYLKRAAFASFCKNVSVFIFLLYPEEDITGSSSLSKLSILDPY